MYHYMSSISTPAVQISLTNTAYLSLQQVSSFGIELFNFEHLFLCVMTVHQGLPLRRGKIAQIVETFHSLQPKGLSLDFLHTAKIVDISSVDILPSQVKL